MWFMLFVSNGISFPWFDAVSVDAGLYFSWPYILIVMIQFKNELFLYYLPIL